jgi:hypothetical protein
MLPHANTLPSVIKSWIPIQVYVRLQNCVVVVYPPSQTQYVDLALVVSWKQGRIMFFVFLISKHHNSQLKGGAHFLINGVIRRGR